MVNINELYPTVSLVSVRPERIEELVHVLKKDGSDTEIVAIIYDEHYYIVEGHAQLLAAAYLGAKHVCIYIVDYKDIPIYSEPKKIESTLSSVGMSTLYDFEGIGGFKYSEYPNYYKK